MNRGLGGPLRPSLSSPALLRAALLRAAVLLAVGLLPCGTAPRVSAPRVSAACAQERPPPAECPFGTVLPGSWQATPGIEQLFAARRANLGAALLAARRAVYDAQPAVSAAERAALDSLFDRARLQAPRERDDRFLPAPDDLRRLLRTRALSDWFRPARPALADRVRKAAEDSSEFRITGTARLEDGRTVTLWTDAYARPVWRVAADDGHDEARRAAVDRVATREGRPTRTGWLVFALDSRAKWRRVSLVPAGSQEQTELWPTPADSAPPTAALLDRSGDVEAYLVRGELLDPPRSDTDASRFVAALASALDDPRLLARLAADLFVYGYDAPTGAPGDLPAASAYTAGDEHQTVTQLLDRSCGGYLWGDCDDLGELFVTVLRAQSRRAFLYEEWGHLSALTLDRSDPNAVWLLDTGRPRFRTAASPAAALESMPQRTDADPTDPRRSWRLWPIDPLQIPVRVRVPGEARRRSAWISTTALRDPDRAALEIALEEAIAAGDLEAATELLGEPRDDEPSDLRARRAWIRQRRGLRAAARIDYAACLAQADHPTSRLWLALQTLDLECCPPVPADRTRAERASRQLVEALQAIEDHPSPNLRILVVGRLLTGADDARTLRTTAELILPHLESWCVAADTGSGGYRDPDLLPRMLRSLFDSLSELAARGAPDRAARATWSDAARAAHGALLAELRRHLDDHEPRLIRLGISPERIRAHRLRATRGAEALRSAGLDSSLTAARDAALWRTELRRELRHAAPDEALLADFETLLRQTEPSDRALDRGLLAFAARDARALDAALAAAASQPRRRLTAYLTPWFREAAALDRRRGTDPATLDALFDVWATHAPQPADIAHLRHDLAAARRQ